MKSLSNIATKKILKFGNSCLIFLKIRPSLTTSEEGLGSITYFRKQRGLV